MSKWKGLKTARGEVKVIQASTNSDDLYDSDPYIVDSTNVFEEETREGAQQRAEKELELG